MENQSTLKSIHSAFLSLPPKIKNWLASQEITFLIDEISMRLGFDEERIIVIPKLVLRLAVQNLDPLDFINELSFELGVSFQTAKSIAQEIEEKLLRPIEIDLRRDVGVDVKMIYFGQPSARKPQPQIEEQKPLEIIPETKPEPLPIEPIMPPAEILSQTQPPQPPPKEEPIIKEGSSVVDLESFKIKTRGKISPLNFSKINEAQPLPETPMPTNKTESLQKPLTSVDEKEISLTSPFVLHQETETNPIPTPPIFSRMKSGPQIKVQNYSQFPEESFDKLRTSKPRPTTIRLEYSDNAPTNNTNNAPPKSNQKQTKRIVHYSGLRTPLNNIGLSKTDSENTVDLRKMFRQ